MFKSAADLSPSTTTMRITHNGKVYTSTINTVNGIASTPIFKSGTNVLALWDKSGNTITFFSGAGGTGLSNSDLSKATATAADVVSGKTFYAGNSTLKTGTNTSAHASYYTYLTTNLEDAVNVPVSFVPKHIIYSVTMYDSTYYRVEEYVNGVRNVHFESRQDKSIQGLTGLSIYGYSDSSKAITYSFLKINANVSFNIDIYT